MNDKRYFNCPKPNERFNIVALGQRIRNAKRQTACLPHNNCKMFRTYRSSIFQKKKCCCCCLCFHRAFEIFQTNDNYIEHDWFLFAIANQWELSISKIAKEESSTRNYSWYFRIDSKWKMNNGKTNKKKHNFRFAGQRYLTFFSCFSHLFSKLFFFITERFYIPKSEYTPKFQWLPELSWNFCCGVIEITSESFCKKFIKFWIHWYIPVNYNDFSRFIPSYWSSIVRGRIQGDQSLIMKSLLLLLYESNQIQQFEHLNRTFHFDCLFNSIQSDPNWNRFGWLSKKKMFEENKK